MKWVNVLKVLPHPALLPLALSTFISVAGPGGVAEITRHASVVPTVAVVQDAPLDTESEPMVLVLRPVTVQTPGQTAPDGNDAAETPAARVEIADFSEATQPVPPPIVDSQDVVTDPPPAAPQSPATPATSDGSAEDPSVEADEPASEDTGGVEDDQGEDSTDTGEGVEADEEPVCDPPGTGPEPHDGVPPGHDQDGDGIDDRCQETGDGDTGENDTGDGDTGENDVGDGDTGDGDTGDGDTGDSDTGDTDTGDTGTGDTEDPVCDPPGTGPEPHGNVPPGHDQNDDGIDDRCQTGEDTDQGQAESANGNGNGNGNGSGNSKGNGNQARRNDNDG